MPLPPESTQATVEVDVDLDATLAPLRVGADDPCWRREDERWWWATRTPEGPGTVAMSGGGGRVVAEAWGPGAPWLVGTLPRLVGASDAGPPAEGPVAELSRRHPGFRVAGHGRVAFAAIEAVCRRGVSAFEAGRAWGLMVEAMGDDAPGPEALRLPPEPRRLASCDPYDLHVLGLDRDGADEVRRIASHATRFESDGTDAGIDGALARLRDVVGVDPATVEHARAVAAADPDALPVLDAHTMAIVRRSMNVPEAATSTGWPDRLERHRPHRGRLVRLLVLAAANEDGERPAGAQPAGPATP